jgi:hypothetical protein
MDDQEFKDEINAYERAGGFITDMFNKKISPIQYITYQMDRIFKSDSSENGGINFNKIVSVDMLENIKNMIEKLGPSPRFLNPLGLMLGRFCIVNNQIDVKRLNLSTDIASKFRMKIDETKLLDMKVSKVDIIKYARLWKNFIDDSNKR